MELFDFRAAMTALILIVVGWMVADQRRLGRMYLWKWPVAGLIVGGLTFLTWSPLK